MYDSLKAKNRSSLGVLAFKIDVTPLKVES